MFKTIYAVMALVCAFTVNAYQVHLNSNGTSTSCSGVWKKGEIFGNTIPFIKISFNPEMSQGKIAYIIYESRNFDYVGIYDNTTGKKEYICDEAAIAKRYCKNSELGQFIVHSTQQAASNNTASSGNSISTSVIDISDSNRSSSSSNSTGKGSVLVQRYDVKETGYYCVAIIQSININSASLSKFDGFVEWHFPYGELFAEDYPKLVFYGITFIVYTVIGLLWGFQISRYWIDILPIQKYITGTILYLIFEMCFNYIYWELYNKQGQPSILLFILVALLNAGRNSVSFFMLLIVCMGYSIVRPTLGPVMKKCIILAIIHFIFGLIYSFGSALLKYETSGLLILAMVLPLAITLTAFYIWIFYSLRHTLIYLETRKQHVKIIMYKQLLWLLVFSVCSVLAIFIIHGLLLFFMDLKTMQQSYWKYKWISLEGLLQILYFLVLLGIIFLWKPTQNNVHYGLQQISQDEDEALDLEEQELRLVTLKRQRSKPQQQQDHAENDVLVTNNSNGDTAASHFINGFELDDILNSSSSSSSSSSDE